MTADVAAVALATLVAKAEITQRIQDYCRAVDRCDRALLDGIFWPDATIDHPPFQGLAPEFCDAALDFIRIVDVSLHTVGNISIELDGKVAYTEAYFTGYHRLAKGLAARGAIADILCPHHRDDRDEDHFVGGRFINWFERRGAVWRVSRHIGFREWERWEDAADRYPIPNMGRADRSDPSYWRR